MRLPSFFSRHKTTLNGFLLSLAIPALALLLLFWSRPNNLTGQVGRNCRYISLTERICDDDVATTAVVRKPKKGFFCIGANGIETDPSKCIDPLTAGDEQLSKLFKQPIKRILTPLEEQKVEDKLNKRTVEDKSAKLQAAMEQAIAIATRLLDSAAFELRANDKRDLQEATKWLVATSDELAAGVDVRRLGKLKEEASSRLQALKTLSQRAERIDREAPKIDGIMGRTRTLLGKAKTVMRNLETADVRVPAKVKRNYSEASQVFGAIRNCKESRPGNCRELMTVLNLIEEMRDPLCELDSSIVSFCRG